MLQGSIAILRHYTTKLVVVLRCRIYDSAPFVIGPNLNLEQNVFYSVYRPFHSEGQLTLQLDLVRWLSSTTDIF